MTSKAVKSLIIAGIILPLGAAAQNPEKNSVKQEIPTVQQNAAQKEKRISYNVPCLTVRGKDETGKISYIPLSFSRSNEDKPLRIMISDDTPQGSGSSLRSSIWLAAEGKFCQCSAGVNAEESPR